jgi:hypothetical protein
LSGIGRTTSRVWRAKSPLVPVEKWGGHRCAEGHPSFVGSHKPFEVAPFS